MLYADGLYSAIVFRMNFLSNILREEGGFDYKKAIVDSIVILISDIPDAKEAGLLHLCEFIEDCEFTYLSTQVLLPSCASSFTVFCISFCLQLCILSVTILPPLHCRYFTSWGLKDLKHQTQANIFVTFIIEYISRMPLLGPVP